MPQRAFRHSDATPRAVVVNHPDTRSPLRVALYSHDTMGLGHTRRNLLVAQALTAAYPGLSALMITGARTSSAFSYPPGVDCLTLPALHKEANGAYSSRSLHLSLGAMARLRSATMMAALEAFNPNVLIVDNVPLGAVQELKQVLRFLRTGGQTRCVLGLRDVLDEPAAVREEWQRLDNEGAIRRWYDEVWVYGDPRVYDLAREYQLSPDIAARVRYTGYLDRQSHQRHTEADETVARLDLPAGPVVACLAGGGQDGAELIRAFGTTPFPAGTTGVILTGPYFPDSDRAELDRATSHRTDLRVLSFLPETAPLLERADQIIAMGGYNTVMEVLSYRKRALIVPRVSPRAEQMVRAEKLAQLGLIDVLHPDRLSPGALAAWLARAPASPPSPVQLDMRGLERLPALLSDLVASAPVAEVI